MIIKLDRERQLRLTLNSMVRFEEITGKSLLQGYDFTQMAAKELAALVSVCLVKEDALTPEEVGEMVTPSNLGSVAAAIVAAWTESVPAGGEGPPPTRPTG